MLAWTTRSCRLHVRACSSTVTSLQGTEEDNRRTPFLLDSEKSLRVVFAVRIISWSRISLADTTANSFVLPIPKSYVVGQPSVQIQPI